MLTLNLWTTGAESIKDVRRDPRRGTNSSDYRLTGATVEGALRQSIQSIQEI
jgi:hypothetical protein